MLITLIKIYRHLNDIAIITNCNPHLNNLCCYVDNVKNCFCFECQYNVSGTRHHQCTLIQSKGLPATKIILYCNKEKASMKEINFPKILKLLNRLNSEKKLYNIAIKNLIAINLIEYKN